MKNLYDSMIKKLISRDEKMMKRNQKIDQMIRKEITFYQNEFER